MITLELNWPPTINHAKKVGRTIRTKSGKILQSRVNTEETKYFYWHTWIIIKRLGIESFGNKLIFVQIELFPPDKRKRDIDNPIKILLDSMQYAGLYDDDNQIARLLVDRRSIIDQGKVIVRIEELICT